jgi:hypothetical protein
MLAVRPSSPKMSQCTLSKSLALTMFWQQADRTIQPFELFAKKLPSSCYSFHHAPSGA